MLINYNFVLVVQEKLTENFFKVLIVNLFLQLIKLLMKHKIIVAQIKVENSKKILDFLINYF